MGNIHPYGTEEVRNSLLVHQLQRPVAHLCSKKISTSQKSTHNYLINKYQQLITQTDNYLEWQDLPFGCAVALVDLTACIKMTPQFINQQPETEIDTGDWKPGRFAWQLDNIRPIVPPMRVIGKQGLFNVEVDLSDYGLEAVA